MTAPEPPFPAALVEEMLRMLARAVRAKQLYLPNNPTFLRALDSAKASFEPIWRHTGEVVLEVTDTQLRWESQTVINEPDKTTDALPWLLYKDGVRELRLLKDVEQQELVSLIDLMTRVRRASSGEDDLLTLLWEQDFSFVRYRHVDLSQDGVAVLEASDLAEEERLVDPLRVRQPAQESILPAGVVNMDDFDTTLYFLDESEIEYLRGEVDAEYSSELRGNVISILLDVYETQADPGVREEICGVLDNLLVHLLANSQLHAVAFLLREAALAAERARQVTAEERERLSSLANRLSEPEALSQLLQSLDERGELPNQEELHLLFEQLRTSALGTLLSWLGRLQNAPVRSLLEATAQRLAAANSAELVRLIGAGDRDVALEAIRRSGAMRAATAVPALGRLLSQQHAEVRLAAVQALADIGTPGALQQLERLVEDDAREIRVAAVRAFAARMHRPALSRIEAAIKGRRVQEADLTEKVAVFEAYGSMCGDAGVPLLDGILNARGFLGKRQDPEVRACAAMALGRVGSDTAIGALQRAASDKELLVRNAVNRALRGGAA
ncbi:MAG: HEAT repeat domain-containing protein [Gemmatimonadaceae bacterium]